MRNFLKILGVCAAVLGTGALVSLLWAEGGMAERKAKILANLKVQFPQLAAAEITVSDLVPTQFDGLDSGSLMLPGRGPQSFLVSRDDKQLFMVAGTPIDVSRSAAEVQALLAEREAAKVAEAQARMKKLDEAIVGLPTRGNPDAAVTIIEFSDFQCPYCSRGATTMDQLLEKYPQDVKLVFKHFPLGFHDWAKAAAIASHCAGQQNHDAFWNLHDNFFANQGSINAGNVVEKGKEFLKGTGVDMAKWSTCAADKSSPEYAAAASAVDADQRLGQSLGVSGTPGFFVNGEFLNGAQPMTAFEPLIARAKGMP